MTAKTILIVGTYDTKNDELRFLERKITQLGGQVISMDVSVLGDPQGSVDISKHQIAEAANTNIEAIIALGDENLAMQAMALGSCQMVQSLYQQGRFDGLLVLGGTMGTDLALDICRSLPIGVPKYVISTVAFSPLIEPSRLAPDIQMILWAGGLYGLNSICKSSLSQAAGAVLGAAQAVEAPAKDTAIVGITSLGTSCLRYVKTLKPALEARGYEVAIFHSTGMGGMAFENMAHEGKFVCVLDLCQQELSNVLFDSLVSSGDQRMRSAGAAGIPQIVAPGAIDLLDYAGWQSIPERFADYPFHEHNRLIKSTVLGNAERIKTAEALAERYQSGHGAKAMIMPLQGVEAWDLPGEPAHDPEGLATFTQALRAAMAGDPSYSEIDAHINDDAFAEAVLAQFDQWVAEGIVDTARN